MIFTCGILKRPSSLAILIDGVEGESPMIAVTAATEDFEHKSVLLKTGSKPFAS